MLERRNLLKYTHSDSQREDSYGHWDLLTRGTKLYNGTDKQCDTDRQVNMVIWVWWQMLQGNSVRGWFMKICWGLWLSQNDGHFEHHLWLNNSCYSFPFSFGRSRDWNQRILSSCSITWIHTGLSGCHASSDTASQKGNRTFGRPCTILQLEARCFLYCHALFAVRLNMWNYITFSKTENYTISLLKSANILYFLVLRWR